MVQRKLNRICTYQLYLDVDKAFRGPFKRKYIKFYEIYDIRRLKYIQ